MAPAWTGLETTPQIPKSARIGEGTKFWGNVLIGENVVIGHNCSIGLPHVEDLREDAKILAQRKAITRIGNNSLLGSGVIIHRSASLGSQVTIDDGCVVGAESHIGDRTRLLYGARIYWRVRIGNESKIAGFCCDRSVIRDNVTMMGILIHKMRNPRAPWSTRERSPVIDTGAFVGFGAIVIGNVKIGRNAYVGAGTIVTKHVRSKHLLVTSLKQESRRIRLYERFLKTMPD